MIFNRVTSKKVFLERWIRFEFFHFFFIEKFKHEKKKKETKQKKTRMKKKFYPKDSNEIS